MCAPPPSSRPIASSFNVSAANLQSLLSNQRFDGSLELSPALANQMDTTVPNVQLGVKRVMEFLQSSDFDLCLKVWLAAWFLSTLNKKYSADRQIWDLASEKTKKWAYSLIKTSPKEKLAELMSWI